MKVRELINALLDCNMDDNILLFLNEPHEDEYGKCSGYLFNIDSVDAKRAEILFTDWRHKK